MSKILCLRHNETRDVIEIKKQQIRTGRDTRQYYINDVKIIDLLFCNIILQNISEKL